MNTLKWLVERELAQSGLSARALAEKLGVSHTTIYRIQKGKVNDVKTIVKVCTALGVEPATVLNAEVTDGSPTSVVSIISALIQAEPRLSSMFAELAQDLETGAVSSDDVVDIVSYATYRLRNARQHRTQEVSGDH
jgi:transcriptional regulator with XRE-family HTH domain